MIAMSTMVALGFSNRPRPTPEPGLADGAARSETCKGMPWLLGVAPVLSANCSFELLTVTFIPTPSGNTSP